MSNYQPDRWVLLKYQHGYKVLGSWYGGYLYGDSWRLNSGVTSVDVSQDNLISFWGASGSCYTCHEDDYGMSTTAASVYQQLEEKHGFKLVEDLKQAIKEINNE